ncbi:MAG: hypothetical protein IIV63_01580, partial [Clostridia bacterium]|nr:hypothetical protein [Clostridia bacterium]
MAQKSLADAIAERKAQNQNSITGETKTSLADRIYAKKNYSSFQKSIEGLNGSTDVNAYKNALNELSRYKGFIDDKAYNQLSDYLSSSIKQIPLNNFSNNYKSWVSEINNTSDMELVKSRTAELAKQLETIKNDISYDDYIALRDEFVNTQTRARKRSDAVNGFKTSVDNALMSDSVTAKDLLELQQAQQNGTGLADNKTIDKVKKHLLGQSTGDYKTDNMVFLKTLRDTAEESGNQKDVEVYDKAIELKQLEIDKGNAKQLSKYLETPLFERQLKEFDNAFTENKTGVTNFKYSASDEFKKDFGEVVVPYFKMQEIRSKIKNGDTLTETELKWALSGYCDNSYFDSETILTKDDYYNMHKNHQKIFNENKSLQFSFDNYITTINDTKAYGNNSLIIAEAYAKSESAGLELKALAADDFDKYANLGSNDEATEFMTATQKGVYNYYLSKGDEQSAYAYKRGIQEDINYREAKELAENAGFLKKSGIAFASGLEKFGEGLLGFSVMLSDITDGPGRGSGVKLMLSTDSVISLATAEIIAGSGTWGKIWYSSMQSLGQQAPLLAIDKIFPVAGLSKKAIELIVHAGMFVSTTGASYIDELNKNKSENEAAVYATINGALEVGLEKALSAMYEGGGGQKFARWLSGGMQNALVRKGLSEVTIALLGMATYNISAMFLEGFEEYLQEIIDPIVRNFVYNEDNDISLFSEEAFISFASGALVSFLFGATNIKSTYRQSLAGASIRSNADGINGLIENAHNALNNPEISVEIKQEISALLETIESKGNQATNIELGQLQELLQIGINQASKKQVEQAFNDLKNDIADAKEMIQNAPDLSETASIDEELQSNLINGTDTTTPGEVSNSDIETKAPNNSTGVSETDRADVDFDTNIDGDIDTDVNVESSSDIDTATESEIAEADYLDNETLESVEENEYDKTIRLMDGREKPLTEAQAYVQSVGRALGYNVVIDDLSRGGRTTSGKSFKGTTRGFFDGQTIYLHEGHTTFEAIVEIFKHEITHYSELNPKMYEKYAKAVFGSKVFENWISGKAKGRSHSARVGQYRQSIIDIYEANGKTLDPTGADREIIANFTSEMLFNEKGNTLERFINEVNSEDRNAVSQFIHDFISWLKARLKGEKVSLKIVKLENRFAAVLRNVDNTNAQKNNTTNDGDVQYEIKENSKGKYVQAKVQVIHSSNPKIQEREIIDYVNNVVREGHDLTITFDNEESIVITGRTAWKLGDKGTYSDEIYLVKGNASGVIDEIIQTSQYKQSKPSFKEHRNGFAENGFNYRSAYFRDLDGKYYKLRLSVGLNSDGKEAYNIGKIEEIPFPDKSVSGSKANGMISLNNKISQKDNVVNTHYMQESENNSSPEQNNDGNSYSFEITPEQDAEYMDAVNNGDMEMAQRLVDEAAKSWGAYYENGKPVKFSHGTQNKDFTVFQKGDIGFHFGTKEQSKTKAGYITPEKTANPFFLDEDGEVKTGRIIDAYLKMDNPLTFSRDLGEWTVPRMVWYFEALLNNESKIEIEKYDRATQTIEYEKVDPKEISDIRITEADRAELEGMKIQFERDTRSHVGESVKDYTYSSRSSELLRNFLISKGYDSIKYLNEYEGTENDYSYAVFFSNQIKSADAVTYDDNGNVIPLSERFNEDDNDIRYSFEDDVVDKTSSLAERVRLGEISQTEYLNELQRLMDEATEKYGAIPKGENPKVDVTVPKQVSD